jgi:hypothetical protein
MSTLVEDIVIQQGVTYRKVYAVTDAPGSIAGYTGRMQVRSSKSSADILAEAEVTVDGINNQLIVYISDVDTTAMDWTRGLYDIELENPDAVEPNVRIWRVAEGAARLSKEVTR